VYVQITAVQAFGMDGLAEGQKLSFDLEEARNVKTNAVSCRSSKHLSL